MNPGAWRSELAPNSGAGAAPAVPSPRSRHQAEGTATAPPRRPQGRGGPSCAPGPCRPAGTGSTPTAGTASGVDFSGASRCPPVDEVDASRVEALPPEVFGVIAVAVEIALQLRHRRHTT